MTLNFNDTKQQLGSVYFMNWQSNLQINTLLGTLSAQLSYYENSDSMNVNTSADTIYWLANGIKHVQDKIYGFQMSKDDNKTNKNAKEAFDEYKPEAIRIAENCLSAFENGHIKLKSGQDKANITA